MECGIVHAAGVGDLLFEFGRTELAALGYFEVSDSLNDVTGWVTYSRGDGVDCYVLGNEIQTIVCRKVCYHGDFQLIGVSEVVVVGRLGVPDEIGEDLWGGRDEPQHALEYPGLGLQVWIYQGVVEVVYVDKVEPANGNSGKFGFTH